MPRRDIVDSGDDIIRLSGLPPVVGPDPRILVLGSFPSALSLEKVEYYANPRNQFFAIIEDLFSIKRDSPYPDTHRCSQGTAYRTLGRDPVLHKAGFLRYPYPERRAE